MPEFGFPMLERSQSQFLSLGQRIKQGLVLPVISQHVIFDLQLGGHQRLVENYAGYAEYPLTDKSDLQEMIQFRGSYNQYEDLELKEDYLYFVKRHIFQMAQENGLDKDKAEEIAEEARSLSVSDFASKLAIPHFEEPKANDPLLILANLDLPIFLTTCQHTFFEDALKEMGKKPVTEFCRWHKGLENIPSGYPDKEYKPTKEQPLVLHLLGLDQYSESLVLTEDNYLEFLVSLKPGQIHADPIPLTVRTAILGATLIFLGYELPSWDFRVLFWGLIKAAERSPKGAFTLQLKPSEEEKQFIENYLKKEAKLDITWMDIHEYTQVLKGLG